jgi:hypothetical protein
MLSISDDNLIPLSQVPRLFPPRANGKTVHISAVYRWAQRGVRGVRLETLKVGGTSYTSMDAVQRFAEELTRASRPTSGELNEPAPSRAHAVRSSASRLEFELNLPPGRLSSRIGAKGRADPHRMET